ncbi:MAG: hypothetical protein V1928_04295 [Parcubacteria group bacterium]
MTANDFLRNLFVLEQKYRRQNPCHVPPIEILGLRPGALMHELVSELQIIVASNKRIIGFTNEEAERLWQKALLMEICRAGACAFDPITRKFPANEDADQTAWRHFTKLNYSAR